MVVAGLPSDQTREPLAAALHQVQPLVLTQGPVVIHRLGHVEEGRDGGDVAPPHLALDLHAGQGHGRKLATGGAPSPGWPEASTPATGGTDRSGRPGTGPGPSAPRATPPPGHRYRRSTP